MLSDFGLARRGANFNLLSHPLENFVGTPRYLAPEVVFDPYTQTADVFSAGLVLWELCLCQVSMQGFPNGMGLLLSRLQGADVHCQFFSPLSFSQPEPVGQHSEYVSIPMVPEFGDAPPSLRAVDADNHPPAIDAALWTQIVSLIRMCWRADAVARPQSEFLATKLAEAVEAFDSISKLKEDGDAEGTAYAST